MNSADPVLAPMSGTEHREIGGIEVDTLGIGEARVKRMIYPVGFRWSTHIKPIVGTDLCMHAHVGFLARGRIQMKELEHYVAFRRLKNFACVKRQHTELVVWARLDPSTVALKEGFSRNVKDIGHAGTGDLEIRIQTAADLERAQSILMRSYQGA